MLWRSLNWKDLNVLEVVTKRGNLKISLHSSLVRLYFVANFFLPVGSSTMNGTRQLYTCFDLTFDKSKTLSALSTILHDKF